MSDEYEVGYKKPPKDTQFQSGQSGNPKGRPKGIKNLKTDVKTMLRKAVELNNNGKKRKVSTQEAALLRLREKALQGDQRALDKMFALAKEHNLEEFDSDLPESIKVRFVDTETLPLLNQVEAQKEELDALKAKLKTVERQLKRKEKEIEKREAKEKEARNAKEDDAWLD